MPHVPAPGSRASGTHRVHTYRGRHEPCGCHIGPQFHSGAITYSVDDPRVGRHGEAAEGHHLRALRLVRVARALVHLCGMEGEGRSGMSAEGRVGGGEEGMGEECGAARFDPLPREEA